MSDCRVLVEMIDEALFLYLIFNSLWTLDWSSPSEPWVIAPILAPNVSPWCQLDMSKLHVNFLLPSQTFRSNLPAGGPGGPLQMRRGHVQPLLEGCYSQNALSRFVLQSPWRSSVFSPQLAGFRTASARLRPRTVREWRLVWEESRRRW